MEETETEVDIQPTEANITGERKVKIEILRQPKEIDQSSRSNWKPVKECCLPQHSALEKKTHREENITMLTKGIKEEYNSAFFRQTFNSAVLDSGYSKTVYEKVS